MSYKIKIYTSNNKIDQLVYNDSKINKSFYKSHVLFKK